MKQVNKELRKVIITSIATIFIIGLPIAYVHEIGHGIICWTSGHKFTFQISVLGGIGHCGGNPDNRMLYLSFGGSLAAMVTAGLILVSYKFISNQGLIIGLYTIMTGHIVNIVLETFLYNFYINSTIGPLALTQGSMYIIWFYLLIRLSKKTKMQIKMGKS